MKIIAWLLALSICALAQPPTITPSTPPVVQVGTTFTFTANQSVTWSLALGSAGSINSSTGVYTAPSSFTANNNLFGCPAFPNDHIYNTRIDNLPVNSAYTTAFHAVLPSQFIAFGGWPANHLTNATPTQSLFFNYSPGNNGPFPILAWPYTGIEAGVLSDPTLVDQHILGMNSDTCQIVEIYKLYPLGSQGAPPIGCSGCNSQAGEITSGNGYSISGATDAASMLPGPMSLRYSELKACQAGNGTPPITHALRFTLSPGFIQSNSFIWPATGAVATGGTGVPFGARVRLQSSFNISAYSAGAQCVLTAMKNYGAFMADIGGSFQFQAFQDYAGDYSLYQVFIEIFNNLATLNTGVFEFVDESSLEDTNGGSPTYQTGRVCPAAYCAANTYETPDHSVTVIATNGSSQSSYMPLILQPVTIGTDKPVGYSFMAGTPATQIPVWVNGSSNTAFSCTMSPTLGTLTTGALYTAPSTSTNQQTTQVTCTASADSSQTISFPIYVYPAGAIRVKLNNNANSAVGAALFTDASSNPWWSDWGNYYRLGGNSGGNCGSGSWTNNLYNGCEYDNADMLFRYFVPNGSYTVTLYFGIAQGSGGIFARGYWVEGVDYQGNVYGGNSAVSIGNQGPAAFLGVSGKQIDVCDIVGGCATLAPGSITLPIINVTSNTLVFAIRNVTPQSHAPGGTFDMLSAISVINTPSVTSVSSSQSTGQSTSVIH